MNRDEIREAGNVEGVKNYIVNEAGEEALKSNLDSAYQVLESLPSPAQKESKITGLILGRIQAGKTMAMITTIALAADTGYRLFVVLTSDNTWLREQTYSRLANALTGLYVYDNGRLSELIAEEKVTEEDIMNCGLVVVCTKNAHNLRNLLQDLERLDLRYIPAMIIDDEADQASLNTNARNPDLEPSTINKLISDLRNKFDLSVYLQVTATPNALLLQPTDHDFHPEFVVVLEPGPGYVGGQILFSEDRKYTREVDLNELLDFLSYQAGMPYGLKRAVCTFLIGATIKHMLTPGIKFYFLCHVSYRKEHHELVGHAISSYLKDVTHALNSKVCSQQHTQIKAMLKEAYDDLSKTIDQPPTFEEVFNRLKQWIPSCDVQILNADSEDQVPRGEKIFNFLIGGNRLGRGVTIKRLLVTYYGRNTRHPNMDTMQQHARMYGYRREDLDVIRIFLPRDMEERFRFLDEADTALRELIKKKGRSTSIKSIMVDKGMRATRHNVLAGTIGYYVAGSVYSPHYPKYRPEDIGTLTEELDNLLAKFNPNNDPNAPAERTTIDMLIQILSLTRSESGRGGAWEDSRIIAALERIKDEFENTAYLIVRRGRNLTMKDERVHDPTHRWERELRNPNYPTLWMIRQEGSTWAGVPFWFPRLQFPDGDYVIMFNMD